MAITMNLKSIREANLLENQTVYNRHGPSVVMFKTLSGEFGRMAMHSMFVLNGGALFVLPAYVGTMTTADMVVDQRALIVSALSFVIGIFFNFCAAFSAYYNYLYQAIGTELLMDKHSIRIKIDSPEPLESLSRDELSTAYNELRDKIKDNDTNIDVTFRTAQIFAIASAIAFMFGCSASWGLFGIS